MRKSQRNQTPDNEIARLSTEKLREKWAEYWGIQPHRYIRREMLEKSLIFKMRELAGEGLSADQQMRLDRLVQSYKKNPRCFDETRVSLKPGTRLMRMWEGQRRTVLTLPDGFEYIGKKYKSLSEIANVITGTRWNGWVFFGLKKKEKA